MIQPDYIFDKDKLKVNVFNEAQHMAESASFFVAMHLDLAIQQKGSAHLILATGSSQFSFIEELKQRDIEWDKVIVFHLDEYKGISEEHPASFRKYLRDRILNAVKPGTVYFLNGDAEDLENEIKKYEKALEAHSIDVACIGIGENGHIAFNDPPVADFNDPELVKIIQLDQACRLQQLNEGWFPTLDDVPEEAVSLTIPAIMSSKIISCVVPERRKAEAIKSALTEKISTKCPASILRTHPRATLFVDKLSVSLLPESTYDFK